MPGPPAALRRAHAHRSTQSPGKHAPLRSPLSPCANCRLEDVLRQISQSAPSPQQSPSYPARSVARAHEGFSSFFFFFVSSLLFPPAPPEPLACHWLFSAQCVSVTTGDPSLVAVSRPQSRGAVSERASGFVWDLSLPVAVGWEMGQNAGAPTATKRDGTPMACGGGR